MRARLYAAGLLLWLGVAGCSTRTEVANSTSPPATSGGSSSPSRHEVVQVMSSRTLADSMRACGMFGDVYVQVVFRGSDGAAVEAYPARYFRELDDSIRAVAPQDADPPLDPTMWECTERALLQLRLSPFAQPTFRVSFPVRVQ